MSKRLVYAIAAAVVIGVAAYAYATRSVSGPSAPTGQEQAADPTPAGGTRYRIAPELSKASFTVDEVLRGSPYTVVGVTQDVSGDIVLASPDARESAVGPILVNARTLKTDADGRNNALKRFILKTEEPANEFIGFRTTSIEGLPERFEAGVAVDIALTGDLTISGVTRTASFQGTVTLEGDGRLTGTAETVVRYKDFDLTIPNVPFVASVDEEVLLKIELVAVRVPEGA